MFTLSVKSRKVIGKKIKNLRQKGILPAVLYGPKIKKAQPLEVDLKQFEKIYREAGESSLISLDIEDKKEKYLVLIHEIARDPLTEKFLHVDFYQPQLEEETEVKVPLIFEGEAPAIKDLGGTLVKNISEIEVKAKPQDLPKEIRVNIGNLKTLNDNISIKDLKLPKEVKILRNPEEIVATVSPPEKVSEEGLEKSLLEEAKVGEKKEEKT